MDNLYYWYTTILKKSDEAFWCATPRQIYSQIDIHIDIHAKKNNNSKGQNDDNNGRFVMGETVRLKGCDTD